MQLKNVCLLPCIESELGGWSFSLGEGEGGFVVADCKMDGFWKNNVEMSPKPR